MMTDMEVIQYHADQIEEFLRLSRLLDAYDAIKRLKIDIKNIEQRNQSKGGQS